MLKTYLKQVFETHKRGDAREESYYHALKQLLENYANDLGVRGIHVTTLPKKTEAGNPDFRVWDGKQHITGYVEAKAPTEEYLDQIATSEQLKRYLDTFPNLILTNFFEFRLYRDGRMTDRVQIGRPSILTRVKAQPPPENEPEFRGLLEKYFSFSLPKVYSAKSLAIELAKRTKFLKEQVIDEELAQRDSPGAATLLGFYYAFQKYLLSGLTPADFADLYAQTITYGLFAARTRSKNGFNRKLAFDNIPRTIGILRDVFRFVSFGDVPPQMEWILDDISQVLAVADVNKILHDFFHEGKGKDPIVHFYETFLAEYDPKQRERRGVYYTPEPVVSYIVRSLHSILKEYFDRPDGFASTNVLVLDPAGGTLTFPAEAAKVAAGEFGDKYGVGGRSNLIRDHILQNFYAFELMMAPYAVGHLKMSFLLEELGYKLGKDERFKLYLTNTLDFEEVPETTLPIAASLAEESHLAGEVKSKTPILAILGNPPYSGHSTNVGEWIKKEIKAYYEVDGKPLGEKNPKWLQDDYVKFIRFAQWKIDRAGEGVLGFITNHSYLDNPTFRGMRQSLMNSFDEIYLLDLHGSSLKKEKCPDGTKDENVFDIRQGVAIMLMIKKPGLDKKVAHSEVWGLREKKYEWLMENDCKSTAWKPIAPRSESYLFVPRDEKASEKYESFPKITDIFPVNSVGIVTARDKFVIDFDKDVLQRRIWMLTDRKIPASQIKMTFALKDKKNWKLADVRQKLPQKSNLENEIIQIQYRPFDVRYILYDDLLIERSRRELMQHMMTHENVGLVTCRQITGKGWEHILATNDITDDCYVSNRSRERGYLFPLFCYPSVKDEKQGELVAAEQGAEGERVPNISENLVSALQSAYGQLPVPERIYNYIYAILFSPSYRSKYYQLLKGDFPRIPFTKDYELFCCVGDLGNSLVQLHLMKSVALDRPIARFQGEGKNRVDKPRYNEKESRVYINKTQYFEGVERDVWEYTIGGYQVPAKWLKDRKDRTLNLDEIKHYCRIITALKKTIELQQQIDEIYPEIEESLIDFS